MTGPPEALPAQAIDTLQPVPAQHARSLWSSFAEPGTRARLEKRDDGLYSALGARVAPVADGIAEFVCDDTQAHFGLQWNRFATVQLDSVNGTTQSRDRLLDQSGFTPRDFAGELVLEVGCGAGRFTEILLRFGARVVSTDFSTAVRANRQNNGRERDDASVVFARADIFDLPFAPQAFDIVLCYGVVQHTGHPAAAVHRLWDMVAPGGVLLVDRYRAHPRTFLPLKYLLRPVTKRLAPEKLLDAIERSVDWLFPRQITVFRRLQGSRILRPVLVAANRLTVNSVFPVNLYVRGELDRETARAWSILDTFDMYGPRYDLPQTFKAFRRCVEDLPQGVVERCVTCGQGSTATIRRAAPHSHASRPVRRQTVLLVLHSLEVGGTERVMTHIVNHIDRDRFRTVLALGVAEGPYLADLRDDVELVVLGHKRARTAGPSIVRAVRRVRPDVIMSAGGMNLGVCLARSAFPPGTRVVLREANTASAFLHDVERAHPHVARMYRTAYRVLYRRADAVICQSRYMMGDLVDLGVPQSKLVCVYNPVDVAHVKALSQAGPAVEREGSPCLVTVGKLHYQKGYDVLLGALPMLLDRHPKLHLTIMGEGEERPALAAQILRLGLHEVVTLAGFQANPYPAIAGADLFVSSSRYEGFANVIAEAHALGTPVVATDCPSANREVIEPGINGWMSPPDDAAALAQTIETGLSELQDIDRSAIRSRCEERFAAGPVLRSYESVLSGNASAKHGADAG